MADLKAAMEAKKAAAAVVVESKDYPKYRAFSRRGYQTSTGLFRPDRMGIFQATTDEQQALLDELKAKGQIEDLVEESVQQGE